MHDGGDLPADEPADGAAEAATDVSAEAPDRTTNPRHGPLPGGGNGLAGLVGSGPSRVGVGGAMRARDVARPRPEDLAAAERDLEIRHARPVDVPTRPPRPVPRPPKRGPRRADQTGSSPERS
jgi:hypothetical protein